MLNEWMDGSSLSYSLGIEVWRWVLYSGNSMGFGARQILARIPGVALTCDVALGLSLNFYGPQFQNMKKWELCGGYIYIIELS